MTAYDQWATREPDYGPEPPLPGDPAWPRCSGCGGFLRLEPDRVVPDAIEYECDGLVGDYGAACGKGTAHERHPFVEHAWEILHRRCSKCGKDNEEVSA